jgi:hypothetical protein
VNEGIELTVRDRALTGSLSTQAFACAPRRIAINDIDDVLRQFANARLLHERPDAGSPVVPIPQGGGPYAYAVTAVQGDWVQLQPMESRPGGNRALNRGWMLARATEAQWSLRRRMPELFFVEGVAGYLAARVQPDAPQAATWLANADAGINRYLEAWGANAVLGPDAAAGGTPLAVAVPRQLRAFVSILRTRGSDAALADALAQFERAASLVPYSSDARNLVTMTRMARVYRQSPAAAEQPRQFIGELRALLGIDPDNDALLRNLGTAYDLVLASPASIPDSERQRLTQERSALAALRKG